MKLFSKEALLLGGIYGLYSFPLTFFKENFFVSLLILVMTLVFFVSIVRLLFNNVPKFVLAFGQKHPRLSIYLTAVGWLFYFIWIFLILAYILFFGGYFYEGSPMMSWLEKYGEDFGNGVVWLLVPSLLGAAVYDYKNRKNHKN